MPAATLGEVFNRCADTHTWEVGMCGQFCAAMYGYGFSGYRDAVAQWQATLSPLRHTDGSKPTAGALLFWGGGSQGHGHVAVSDGEGGCWSIDISGPGTVSRVSAGTINARWGLPYLGWIEPYFQGERWEPVAIYGVDVSNYQPINFALTTPGDNKRVDFAIIKITEGLTYLNSKWTAQRQWARDHDLSVGFYHFARPGSMVDQADYFLSKINLQPGDHLWFDWEDSGVSSGQKDAWISYVQGRCPGHRVGLYCNTDFWKNRDTSGFAGDGLWIATGGIPAGAPPIRDKWLIHQYSTAGGYDHDLAQFASKADMIAWAGDDVALSADDKAWISARLDEIPAAVLTRDGILESPLDSPTHDTNPFWSLESYVKDTGARVRTATGQLIDVLAQARTNGSGITALATALTSAHTKLDAVAATLDSLDLSNLPAEVAAKIEALKLVVTVEGS